jgi:prefoldin subunit 5
MIDWNIRFGDLAVVASLGGTCLFYATKIGRFSEMIENMQKQIEKLEDTTKKIADVVTAQAVQDTRLNNISSRMNRVDENIEDLRRGRGYINNKDQKVISNEY